MGFVELFTTKNGLNSMNEFAYFYCSCAFPYIDCQFPLYEDLSC